MNKNKWPHNLFKNFEHLTKLTFFTIIFSWFLTNYYVNLPLYSDFFAILLALTALSGAVFSFYRAKEWGLFKSFIGQSMLYIGFSLLMWAIGQTFYFLDSMSTSPLQIYEFFFVFIDPFYLIGMFYLASAIGTFKYLKANLSMIVLPILIFLLNILVVSFIKNWDFFNLINNFSIDDVYILGSIILATFVISILIFSKKLGGIYKTALYLILFGILFQYVGDNIFAFNDSQQVNGSLSDLLFFVSISLVTYGIYKLDPKKLNE